MALEVQEGFYTIYLHRFANAIVDRRIPELNYSFLHEIESIIWLGLWLCTSTQSTGQPPTRLSASYDFDVDVRWRHRERLESTIFSSLVTLDRMSIFNPPTISIRDESFTFFSNDAEKRLGVKYFFFDLVVTLYRCYEAVTRPGIAHLQATYADCFKGAKAAFKVFAEQFGSLEVHPLYRSDSESLSVDLPRVEDSLRQDGDSTCASIDDVGNSAARDPAHFVTGHSSPS